MLRGGGRGLHPPHVGVQTPEDGGLQKTQLWGTHELAKSTGNLTGDHGVVRMGLRGGIPGADQEQQLSP